MKLSSLIGIKARVRKDNESQTVARAFTPGFTTLSSQSCHSGALDGIGLSLVMAGIAEVRLVALDPLDGTEAPD